MDCPMAAMLVAAWDRAAGTAASVAAAAVTFFSRSSMTPADDWEGAAATASVMVVVAWPSWGGEQKK